MVDLCVDRNEDISDHEWIPADSAGCLTSAPLPLFHSQLNVDTPLQLGGIYSLSLEPSQYGWTQTPRGVNFDGCIRNLMYNGEVPFHIFERIIILSQEKM